jgi:hypothetical protein
MCLLSNASSAPVITARAAVDCGILLRLRILKRSRSYAIFAPMISNIYDRELHINKITPLLTEYGTRCVASAGVSSSGMAFFMASRSRLRDAPSGLASGGRFARASSRLASSSKSEQTPFLLLQERAGRVIDVDIRRGTYDK